MKIKDAIKLQTGDKIRCGPNRCGCTGRVYTVNKETIRCGCELYFHTYNHEPFLINSNNCNSIRPNYVGARWAGSGNWSDTMKMSLARNLTLVEEKEEDDEKDSVNTKRKDRERRSGTFDSEKAEQKRLL